MPAVIPAHIAIRETLKKTVHDSVSLNNTLELVIAVKTKQPGAFHGKISHSPPPWHAPAANAILDLHALARKLEASLRFELNLPARKRGGSSGNTVKALHAIPRLCEGTDDFAAHLSNRELKKWSSRAEIALNMREMPHRLPRPPGLPEPPCPICETHMLRTYSRDLDERGEVRCGNPVCFDGRGNRTSARLEFFHGELVFRWSNGMILRWEGKWVS